MALPFNINLGGNSTTPYLIADLVQTPNGSPDGTASLTTVLNPAQTLTLPVSAALELQSTKGALVLPRLSSAQIAGLDNANSTVTNGMLLYNMSSQSIYSYTNGAWGFLGYNGIVVTLNQQAIQHLNSANPAKVLIAAPGAGNAIIVHKAVLVNNFNTAAFQGGGAVTIGYGTTQAAIAAANALSATIPANFVNIAGPAGSTYSLNGQGAAALAGITNVPISIACATGDFTNGNAASTINIYLWYSIVPALT